ncbi:Uncharacterised protein [uncultured Blautia sp.]|nr:Uncharacterised protein [uncultured Blautia sp.]
MGAICGLLSDRTVRSGLFYRNEPWCHSLLWRDTAGLSPDCGKGRTAGAFLYHGGNGHFHGGIRRGLGLAPGRRLFLGNAGRSAERSAAVAAERVPRPEGGFRAGGAWKAPCRCAGRRDCRGNRGSCTGAHADGAVCIYREQLPLPGSRCRGRRDLYVFR